MQGSHVYNSQFLSSEDWCRKHGNQYALTESIAALNQRDAAIAAELVKAINDMYGYWGERTEISAAIFEKAKKLAERYGVKIMTQPAHATKEGG